jgi:hypothetical protein
MNTREARALGDRLARQVEGGGLAGAHELLAPVLAQRTPFALLRKIGAPLGAGPLAPGRAFAEQVAAGRTEGGWVIVQSILERHLDRDLAGSLDRCRAFIVQADVWYAADILAEGVAGQALVRYFDPALAELAPWRDAADAWLRRATGTATHFWAKRSRGAAELAPRAQALLQFLAPVFGEWDMIAVKGVGWGLKTLGRYYPGLVADWLAEEIVPSQRRHRALMLRKALTYLPPEQRARVVPGT